jgi:RES domain-containing protein
MIVYRISNCRFIDDLSGRGAAMYGGRWNSEGIHVLYTAGSPSLAMLESLVHMGGRVVGDFCQIALEVPEEGIYDLHPENLPEVWRENPPPDILKTFGNKFIADNKYFMLKVPSVLVPDESNYLINPVHPAFKQLRVLVKSKVKFDERLVKKSE